MKKSLLITGAALLVAGSAFAQVEEPTLKRVWKHSTTIESRSAAAYNGTVYVQNGGKLLSWDKTNNGKEVLEETKLAGHAITCDQAGNIVYSQGKWGTGATDWGFIKDGNSINFILAIPAGASKAGSTYSSGRIIGDITSEKGGYMYVGSCATEKVVMYHLKNMGKDNQEITLKESSAFGLGNFSGDYNVQPMENDIEKLSKATNPENLVYVRKRQTMNINYIDDKGSVANFAAPSDSYSTLGFDVFVLSDGIKYGIYPLKFSGTYSTSFAIVDLDKGNVVAQNAAEDVIKSSGSQYNTLLAEKVSATKVNIYQFTSKTQVAMYTFEIPENLTTAIETVDVDANAPVEYYNLQGVKVENPSNGIFIKKQGTKTQKVVL